MIANKVKPALMKKWPGWQRKGVILLYDNAHPHTAQLTLETLKNVDWEILPHPSYSPDVAPSDLFCCNSNEEVKEKSETGSNIKVKNSLQRE